MSSKQAPMADHTSLLSPTTPISSFLGSPRFSSRLTKNISDSETTLFSPTSILDTKNSASFVNPFGYEINQLKPQTPSHEINKSGAEAIGLALIDSLNEEKNDGNFSKPISRLALFGSKLNVQVPAIHPPLSPVESPKSLADFGIKTRSSHLLSPSPETPSRDFTRQLSWKEMELSEDYTCVITHGPNPRTTHIFANCIVESCCGEDIKISDHKKMEWDSETSVSTSASADFLSFCHTCRDSLGQGKDIYIYKGEKAFCSHECRCQEMLFEGIKNPELDDAF